MNDVNEQLRNDNLKKIREYLVGTAWKAIKEEATVAVKVLEDDILDNHSGGKDTNVTYNELLFGINELAQSYIDKIDEPHLKHVIKSVIIDFNNERLLIAPWKKYEDGQLVSIPSCDIEEYSTRDLWRCQRKIHQYIVSIEDAFAEKDWQEKDKKDNIFES